MAHNTLCFVAGRSGGHILPALTLAYRFKQHNTEGKLLFFSTQSALDTTLVGNKSMVDWYIPLKLENVPYKRIYHMPRFLWHCMQSLSVSIYYLYKHKPAKVISTGGYISIPVCLAAWLLRIPVELYELNAVPGKAAKFLTPFVDTIALCFATAERYFPAKKCRQESYPLRFTEHDKESQQHALEKVGFTADRKTLFILGGSQGSLFINEFIKQWIEQSPAAHQRIQIIHQTGHHAHTDWQTFYERYAIPAIIFSYHDQVQDYYAAADLIICRSGAGTLWEISFFGKHALTIPLETATTDHQVVNARAIQTQFPKLFTVITQKEVIADRSKAYAAIANILVQSNK